MLVAALVGCPAVGLYIHHHFVALSISTAAEKQAIAELAAGTEELFCAVGRLESSGPAAGSAEWAHAAEGFQRRRSLPGLRWTLTDSQWRVFAQHPTLQGETPGSEPAQSDSSEKTLAWLGPPEDAGARQLTGSLAMPDGRHVAVARRLKDRDGYAVIHYPLEQAKVAPAELLGSLPAAGVITWIWTSSVLVTVVYMITTRFYDELGRKRAQAETASLRRIQSLVRTRDAVIFGLAQLAESRDEATGHHLERISAYASRLAAAVGHHPKYRGVVTSDFVKLIGVSSALHDIGKVGIADSVLLKPGPLNAAERLCIQQHSAIGAKCLQEIEQRLGTSNFLQMARQIAQSHHERWDGAGYPDGLIGEEIPLAARIVAVADVYEALSSPRVYKEAFPHERCVQIIRSEAGKQFERDIVETFLKIETEFFQIARQYGHGVATAREFPPLEPTSDEDWRPRTPAPGEDRPEQNRTAPASSPVRA